MRIWISGGGTGGHVYPALTVLDSSSADGLEVTWLGRRGSMEEMIVTRRGIDFVAVSSAPVLGRRGTKLLTNLWQLLRGCATVWRRMSPEGPDVLLVTGGYVSVPAAIAARLRGIPLAVFLPDVVPGRAVRLEAALANRILVTHERALDYLPTDRSVVTGYPVRQSIRDADRNESRLRMGISPAAQVLFVFGGSQGARRLNEAVQAAAEELLHRVTLVHVTGKLDVDAVTARRAAINDALAERWHVHEYLHDEEMAAALAAADLVVCRAGAATLGELPARGLPALLVPLPIAAGHQSANAQVLAGAGAAVEIEDGSLDGDRLLQETTTLLEDPDRLAAMSASARGLDRPDAARMIWQETVALVREPRPAQ